MQLVTKKCVGGEDYHSPCNKEDELATEVKEEHKRVGCVEQIGLGVIKASKKVLVDDGKTEVLAHRE